MNKLEKKMFDAMDVAIQWIDEKQPQKAREALAIVYLPILQKRKVAK